jgi:3-oxoacyl-(acyl-carrier-protein) synthase
MSFKAVITGIGMVSAAGANTQETLDSFKTGRRSVGPVSIFDTALTCPVFEAKGFKPRDPRRFSRTLELTFHAVTEALQSCGLTQDIAKFKVGVCLGTTIASQINDLEFYKTFRSQGQVPMEAIDRFLNGNLARALAGYLGVSGPCAVSVNACSSGTDAVGIALSWLEAGICDIAICGGADELNLVPLCGFNSLGVVSNVPCAPFDRDRKGLNLGEGAGVLVLENQEVSAKRGNKSRLYVAGYGIATDAYHLTAPRPDGTGLATAINMALQQAGLKAADIGFINAHGTATRDNDKTEGAVLARVFGPQVKFLSTKGFTGHTLGAAGGLEAGFSALALKEGWLPASPGFVNQDPDIGVSPLTAVTDISAKYAMSTSLAFGGNNSALVLGID